MTQKAQMNAFFYFSINQYIINYTYIFICVNLRILRYLRSF